MQPAAGGQHLGRAAPPFGVERVAQGDHRRQVLGGEQLGHELHLLDADAVLAGDAPADVDALVEDLVAGLEDALDLLGSRSSKSRIGWMLPSPAWKTLAIRMSCRRPTSVMNRRMCGSFVRGTTPSWVQNVGLSRPMAPKADLRLFQMATYSGSLRVRQAIDFSTRAAVRLDDLGDRLRLAVQAGLQAVHLDDQHGAGLGRKAETERLLDGPDHQVVEHLQRRRDDAGGDDPADGLGRRVHASRTRPATSGPPRGRGSGSPIDLRDDAEGPLVADDQPGQVVARVILGDAAGLRRRVPSGMTSSTPRMWLTVTPYLSVCGPPELVADVAADRAGPLARRVGRVVKPGARPAPGSARR